jgi:fluoride exporter
MLFAISLGGAVGSLLRHAIATVLGTRSAGFPFATLLVNVTGSLLLGLLVPRLDAAATSPELRAALTIGLCGGYTTFSTFSLETVRMFERGRWALASTYIASSVLLSVLAMLAGLMLSRAAVAT